MYQYQSRSNTTVPNVGCLTYQNGVEPNPTIDWLFSVSKKSAVGYEPPEGTSFPVSAGMNIDNFPLKGEEIEDEDRRKAAYHLVDKLLSQTNIDRLVQPILDANNMGGTAPKRIVVVTSTPKDPSSTQNVLPPAFAQRLAERIEDALGKTPLEGVPVEVDGIANEDKISSAYRHSRSARYDRHNDAQLTENMALRIAKQPIYEGAVDPEAFYILADDTVHLQTTLRNLAGYIEDNGATVAGCIALRGKSRGVESVDTTDESLSFLNATLSVSSPLGQRNVQVLQKTLARVGLDYAPEQAENTTLTNGETLLLGALLADPNNLDHQAAYHTALNASGFDPSVIADANIGLVFEAAPSSVGQITEIINEYVNSIREELRPLDNRSIGQSEHGGITA